jgi:uncharacterized membrane protein
MVKNEGQRCIYSLFQTISSEERMQIVEKGLAQMRESNKDATSCSVQKEKCLVDRLKIQHSVKILSEHETKKEDNETSDLQNIKRDERRIKTSFNYIFGPKY